MIYNFLISTDTASAQLNASKLRSELVVSVIAQDPVNVYSDGDSLFIEYSAELTTEDQGILNSVVGAHDGAPDPEAATPQLVSFENTTSTLGIPQVAITADEGDFDTKIGNNLCVDASAWEMRPDPGTVLFVQKSEIQFTHDIVLGSNAVKLQYYVWHPAFPEPVLGQEIVFDTLYSMFEYGNTHSSTTSPIGTEIPHNLTTIHFDYIKKLVFHGDRKDLSLAYLRVVLSDDQAPLGGSYCKATFVTESR